MVLLSIIAHIGFWVSVGALLHSYILYPLLLQVCARNKQLEYSAYTANDELPQVKVFMAVYNEEEVIAAKLDSLLNTSYPAHKLTMFIGSDGSDDQTDAIIQHYAHSDERINLHRFEGRQGKPNIINQLVSLVSQNDNEVYIFTDANVIFTESTIFELVKYFRDPSIGLVGANVVNKDVTHDGISLQEKAYIQRENYVKHLEGLCWGTMMGAFGACYAIRGDAFEQLPPNFLVDDFYITINILKKGKKAINNLQAICYEDVSNEMSKEFTRKIRISTGNFQNLRVHYTILWPPFRVLAFSFFSHKVLRWLGPFFLLIALVTSAYLVPGNIFYSALFIAQGALLLLPGIDYLLKKGGIHSLILRFISYFYSMNLALLIGFFQYLKGVHSNVWERTKRHQF